MGGWNDRGPVGPNPPRAGVYKKRQMIWHLQGKLLRQFGMRILHPENPHHEVSRVRQ